MKPNVLTQADAYKLSHEKLQHEGAEFIYSNMTPRGSKYLPVMKEFYDNKSVFFGLQYFRTVTAAFCIYNAIFSICAGEPRISRYQWFCTFEFGRVDGCVEKESESRANFQFA